MQRVFCWKVFFLFFVQTHLAQAQTTLRINLRQADSIFINNSFYLLASSMNIEAQKAQIIQAKLYPNPIVTADLNAYNPERNRLLDIGNRGQKVFQVEQLIRLGGKRQSEIEMATTHARIAELEFRQLARQLKYRLHSDLFAIGQQQILLARYNSQLSMLDTLLAAYQTQADKGNIPLKEVVRLKGAYLKLNNDRAGLYQQYFDAQGNLQALLQTNKLIEFEFSENELEKYTKRVSLDEIKNEALSYRPEFLMLQQNQLLAEQYLQYQRKLAIPDLNLFVSYDQRGGAFNNQINAGVAMPLPIRNKNQGNIKSAQYKTREIEYQLQSLQNEIMSSLQNSYASHLQTISEYQKAKALYNQDFEITVKGMTDNFQKRNVSIVEFIDFFEAYNDVQNELTRIRTHLVASGEQLSLLVGKDIF
ncbi:MAG: TolC family protein [Runella sp.]